MNISIVVGLVVGIVSLTNSPVFADGCVANDRNDSYANMQCPNRSSGRTFCEYDDACRWTSAQSGSCGARNENDAYAKTKCPSRSSDSTFCEYDSDCVWIL